MVGDVRADTCFFIRYRLLEDFYTEYILCLIADGVIVLKKEMRDAVQKLFNFVRKSNKVKKNIQSRLIKFEAFNDNRGWLAVVENASGVLPFQIERVFWIGGVPENETRGCHAHRFCSEIVIPVYGSFKATVTDFSGTSSYEMNNPQEGLFIPPMAWCEFSDFSAGSVCLCLASGKYDIEGYIDDFDKFVAELR